MRRVNKLRLTFALVPMLTVPGAVSLLDGCSDDPAVEAGDSATGPGSRRIRPALPAACSGQQSPDCRCGSLGALAESRIGCRSAGPVYSAGRAVWSDYSYR